MVAAIPPIQSPSFPLDVDRPEPHAAATEAADDAEMPLPSDPRTFFLGGLFALGVLAALYVASSITPSRRARPRAESPDFNPLSVSWGVCIYRALSERS